MPHTCQIEAAATREKEYCKNHHIVTNKQEEGNRPAPIQEACVTLLHFVAPFVDRTSNKRKVRQKKKIIIFSSNLAEMTKTD